MNKAFISDAVPYQLEYNEIQPNGDLDHAQGIADAIAAKTGKPAFVMTEQMDDVWIVVKISNRGYTFNAFA
jgi:hypothetical protein